MQKAPIAVAFTLLASAAQAQTLSLDITSLPSTQPGWSFNPFGVHAGRTEAEYIAPGGPVMTFDSMGFGATNSPGSMRADRDLTDLIESPTTTVAEVEVRIVQSEVVQFHYGFFFSLAVDGWSMALGFSSDRVQTSTLATHLFDTTDWHTYTLVSDYNTSTYDLFIDGSYVLTNPMTVLSDERASIGDGTGTANARAEVRRFSFTVPSPGSIAAMAAGALLAVRRRR